jgi:2-polyprenyl-3-methyl-5-hydroxy-6-metoxy-1,4-benzoquinol methylase
MSAAPAPPTVPVPTCPACGEAGRDVLHAALADLAFGVAGGRWTLHRCRGCGAAYLDPRPADEAIAGLYASYYTHEPPSPNIEPAGRAARMARALRNGHLGHALGYRLRPALRPGAALGRLLPGFAALAERPVRGLPAGARVLDVGAGNGLFVAEACGWGLDASGIDLDREAVAAGRRAGLDLAVETAAQRAAREPRAYDAVTLSHVIEHVPDPVELLRDCAALLRPGAGVWIATPNLAASGHRRFGDAWLHLDPPRHLVLFDARSLTAAAAAAGLRDAKVLHPVPTAAAVYAGSAAIARGEVAGPAPPTPPRPIRMAAVAADLRAQLRPRLAEELVVVARSA